MVNDLRSRLLADGLRAVGAAGIHNHNLVGKRHAGKQTADAVGLVFGDNGHADFLLIQVAFLSPRFKPPGPGLAPAPFIA